MNTLSTSLPNKTQSSPQNVYKALVNSSKKYQTFLFMLMLLPITCQALGTDQLYDSNEVTVNSDQHITLGSRPHVLIKDMEEGQLKDQLLSCKNKPLQKSLFSIAHRGAPLHFPEHTKESYLAAAQQGAGMIECDVTFTKDRELVCRHSQCDLHSTTNILSVPELAAKCSIPFTPADPLRKTTARAKCCTSDITLNEFKSLCGRLDSVNNKALTIEQYLSINNGSEADFQNSCGTLLSHKESIDLFKQLDVKFMPELKEPQVAMPFQGAYSQQHYAQQMIDEYKQANVAANDVWVQSFHKDDLLYWVEKEPKFSKQAVFLDNRTYKDSRFRPTLSDMQSLKNAGINFVAPPIFALLSLDSNKQIIPSQYAELAQAANLKIIAWSFERSGSLTQGGGFYYQTVKSAISKDGDIYKVLDVLAQQVGVIGVFSDWPATVTYYANCLDLY